ncbi:MAG: hypothetical protein AAGH92_10175, partial [Planctomycetota bacterium]
LADMLFTGPWSYRGRPADAGLLGLDGGASLIPAHAACAGKKSWTLRLHETLGRRGGACLRLAEGWIATPTDLRGESIGPKLGDDGRFAFTPYAVLSFRIERV